MSHVKVFVGSLPPGISEETLGAYLAPHGQFASMLVKNEQRYAFVFYPTMGEAQQAISSMNGTQVEGSTIVAKLANNQGPGSSPTAAPSPQVARAPYAGSPVANRGATGAPGERIYIKGLPAGMTDETVGHLFSGYGTVTDAKVLVSDGLSNDGTGQTVAIVRMASVEEAQWCVTNLNGNIPQTCERPVEVSYAGARGPNGAAERPAPYVAGGGVRHAALPGAPPPPPGQPPVWGGRQGVVAVAGAPVAAGPRGPLHPTVASLKLQGTPNSKLYIKGLPQTADDSYLYKIFAPWGRVVEAVAVNKGTYCIGFVQYMTDEEAQEGINNVNQVQLVDGTTLQVSVKVQK